MLEWIQYYLGESFDPYQNLALEQYLLETVPEHICILYLWQNKNTVVIGKNQNCWRECRTEQIEADGGVVARRLSGGGAVYHDLGNLNFTFLARKADYDVDRQLSVILEACGALGLDVRKTGRNDITIDGRKFSGNAFYESDGRCYHHGTIMVDVDAGKLSRYLNVSPQKLASKGVSSVRARVVNLSELCPALTVEQMKSALVEAFGCIYGLTPQRLDEERFDRLAIEQLRARNAAWEWNFGRRLPMSVSWEGRFLWGELELALDVDGGIVREARAYSDAMDWRLFEQLGLALIGCRFSTRTLAEAARSLSGDAAVIEDIAQWILAQEV